MKVCFYENIYLYLKCLELQISGELVFYSVSFVILSIYG